MKVDLVVCCATRKILYKYGPSTSTFMSFLVLQYDASFKNHLDFDMLILNYGIEYLKLFVRTIKKHARLSDLNMNLILIEVHLDAYVAVVH